MPGSETTDSGSGRSDDERDDEAEDLADDTFEWTNAPGAPDAGGAPGEFVDVGPNPPGEEVLPGTPSSPNRPPGGRAPER